MNTLLPTFLAGLALAALSCPAAASDSSAYHVEAGARGASLSNGQTDNLGVYVTGSLKMSDSLRVSAEAVHLCESGKRCGQLVGVSAAGEPVTDLLLSGAVSFAHGVDTFPRLRLDVEVGKKWLASKSLVSYLALTHTRAWDGHTDLTWQPSLAYYFDLNGLPASTQVGWHTTRSMPGAADSDGYFMVTTIGRTADWQLSLRYDDGSEAYTTLDPSSVLVDHTTRKLSFDWINWVTPSSGYRVQVGAGATPDYHRVDVAIGWFVEF